MSGFTSLDWVVLVGYLLLAAGLGLFLSGRNKNLKDFMFGGGKMPWFAVGISLIATSVSATTFLGNPADSYQSNMAYLMCNIGGLIAIIIVWKVFIPRFRDSGVQSAYELLERAFNRPVRLVAGTLYSLHLLLRTGILLYVPSLVLAPILQIEVWQAIMITSVLAIVYTYFGGIKAVIWTDVIQFVVLMGGGIAVFILVSQEVGGFSELFKVAAEGGKTEWLILGADPANARNLLSAGFIYVLFEVALRGCDQQFIQRYLSCKSTKEAGYSTLFGAFMGLLVGILFYWIGAGLYVFFQKQGLPPELVDKSANEIFPYFILHYLPAGLTGLLVAAIYAAAMSSLDSAITALSNTTLIDFIGIKNKNDKESVGHARFWVLIWGLLGTGAALLAAQGEKSILDKALFFTSLFTGPLLGLFLFAFFRPSIKPNLLIVSTILGMCSLLLFKALPFWEYKAPLQGELSWPWLPLVSLSSMILVAMIGSIWIKPQAVKRA